MAKQNISITLDSDLLDRLEEVTKETERKRSWLINKAIETYLEELEDLKIAKNRLRDERFTPARLRKQLGL